jgi:hypothetical protein
MSRQYRTRLRAQCPGHATTVRNHARVVGARRPLGRQEPRFAAIFSAERDETVGLREPSLAHENRLNELKNVALAHHGAEWNKLQAVFKTESWLLPQGTAAPPPPSRSVRPELQSKRCHARRWCSNGPIRCSNGCSSPDASLCIFGASRRTAELEIERRMRVGAPLCRPGCGRGESVTEPARCCQVAPGKLVGASQRRFFVPCHARQ